MKAFGVLLVSLFVSNAHAEWMSTKCSNSDGSVYWSYGTDENEIHLKYANFVEGTLSLNIEQVNIELKDDVTIQTRDIKACAFKGRKHVYAGNVTIKASEKHPEILRGQFPLNKVETEVICTTITTEPIVCKDE